MIAAVLIPEKKAAFLFPPIASAYFPRRVFFSMNTKMSSAMIMNTTNIGNPRKSLLARLPISGGMLSRMVAPLARIRATPLEIYIMHSVAIKGGKLNFATIVPLITPMRIPTTTATIPAGIKAIPLLIIKA